MKNAILLAALIGACILALSLRGREHAPKQNQTLAAAPPPNLVVANNTGFDTTVYVAFGSTSVIKASNWASFCTNTSDLNCSFPLAKNSKKDIWFDMVNLNATFSFGAPVGCGATKAEVNLNTPNHFDTFDVSLVDGFNFNVQMWVASTLLGPTKGKAGNEAVLGVFPYGCDVCVARQSPPCGISPGTDGCKAGTQYDPVMPCQVTATKPGSPIKIELVL